MGDVEGEAALLRIVSLLTFSHIYISPLVDWVVGKQLAFGLGFCRDFTTPLLSAVISAFLNGISTLLRV